MSARGLRVLVVDDHEIVRFGLRRVLGDTFPNARIGEAGRPAEAIEHLEREPWDVVLLDINLPGRGGMDLLGEIHRRWPRCRVVMLSVFGEEEFALRCLRAGAAAYVSKVSAIDELVAALKKVAAGGKYVTPALAEQLASSAGRDVDPPPHATLSNRELEVLRHVAGGATIKQIAATMALSEKTIATYRARMGEKLALSTNVELTRYALRHGLIRP